MTVENLAAARGLRVLFEGLSARIVAGEVLELRGPNGSGKSTLLRIIAGLTRAHAGDVKLEGLSHDDGPETACHYLGHLDAVKPTETAREQALFWARYFGRPRESADAALKRVGLANRLDVPGRGLSAGQKRRLALTRLLIAPRPVWLLDEPTAALDIEGRQLVLDLAEAHRKTGGLIITAIHGDGFPNAATLDLTKFPARAVA